MIDSADASAAPRESADDPVEDQSDIDKLVDRALRSAGARCAADIHEWGQYHDSRLARHVLARLACPDDPGAALRPGADRSLRGAALDLEAVCALAASIALKARDGRERAVALGLFELARRRLGPRFPAEYREFHVMTAYLDGRVRRAKALLRSYGGLSRLAEALRCMEAHPVRGGSTRAYLRRLRAFAGWPELLVPEDEAGAPHLDRLRTEPVRPIPGGPLISVVMTCFEPGEALLTAVRSVVAQSWQNWELLLVDDGSGPRFRETLAAAARMDPRVRLLVQPENAGTYQARNRALAVAEGAFLTGLDSDDWAHPRRLERQARPLLDDQTVVMVESPCVAVHEDLSLVIDPQVGVLAARSTPIMVRADPVMRRVGFFDEVRKTADSEYRGRIKAAFGRRAVARPSGPLTLVRHTGSTLSAGEVSRHWMSASRLAYHSGFSHWHRQIRKGAADPFMASLPRPRPFPIAADITRSTAATRSIVYARIFAADWRSLGRSRRLMLDEAARLTGRGMRIGLVHCPEWIEVDGKRPLICRQVLASAEKHGFDFVDLEERHTAPVVVPDEAYGELLRFEHPHLAADRIAVQAPTPGPPPPVRSRRPREPLEPDRPLTRKDAALAGAGLCSSAAAIALAAAAAPDAIPWTAAASLAIWTALVPTLAARRLASRVGSP